MSPYLVIVIQSGLFAHSFSADNAVLIAAHFSPSLALELSLRPCAHGCLGGSAIVCTDVCANILVTVLASSLTLLGWACRLTPCLDKGIADTAASSLAKFFCMKAVFGPILLRRIIMIVVPLLLVGVAIGNGHDGRSCTAVEDRKVIRENASTLGFGIYCNRLARIVGLRVWLRITHVKLRRRSGPDRGG